MKMPLGVPALEMQSNWQQWVVDWVHSLQVLVQNPTSSLSSSLEQGCHFCFHDGETQAWKQVIHMVPDLRAGQHFTLGFQNIFFILPPKEIRRFILVRVIICPLTNLMWFRRLPAQAMPMFRRWTPQIPLGDRSNTVFRTTFLSNKVCKQVQIWTIAMYHQFLLASTSSGPELVYITFVCLTRRQLKNWL